MAGGFLVGSLPTWLFYALHGDPARGTLGTVAPLFRLELDLSMDRLSQFWQHTVLRLLGTSTGSQRRRSAWLRSP